MIKGSKREWIANLRLIRDLLRQCYDESAPFQTISDEVDGRLRNVSDEFAITLRIAPVVARAQIEVCRGKFIAILGLFDSLSIIRGDEGRAQYKLIGVKLNELYSDFEKIIVQFGAEDDVR